MSLSKVEIVWRIWSIDTIGRASVLLGESLSTFSLDLFLNLLYTLALKVSINLCCD